MKPTRIQRRRTKGWKLPPGTICVTRRGVFGNPWTVEAARLLGHRTNGPELAAICVRRFREWLTTGRQHWWPVPVADGADRRAEVLARLPELRGKNLACWCPEGSPCHATVLLELANAEDRR